MEVLPLVLENMILGYKSRLDWKPIYDECMKELNEKILMWDLIDNLTRLNFDIKYLGCKIKYINLAYDMINKKSNEHNTLDMIRMDLFELYQKFGLDEIKKSINNNI